jgi:hypothetical protein
MICMRSIVECRELEYARAGCRRNSGDARWDVKMRKASNEVREIGRYKTVAREESKQNMESV